MHQDDVAKDSLAEVSDRLPNVGKQRHDPDFVRELESHFLAALGLGVERVRDGGINALFKPEGFDPKPNS